MNDPRDVWAKLSHLVTVYPGALWGGWRQRRLLRSVRTVCLFLGNPRSGHSLVGALLDAHPDAAIAHEADILKYVFARFGRNQLLHLMLDNSQTSAAAGRTWQGYSYQVREQWQGRHRALRVVGDKHGEATTLRLMLVPGLLNRVRRTLGPDLRFIHVIRNPYDTIARILKKGPRFMANGVIQPSGDSLRDAVSYYFALGDAVADLKAQLGDDVLDVRHEDLIARPKAELARICRFLDLDVTEDYLASCAAIVFTEPHLSRHEATWTPELRQTVEREMARFSFFDGYSFER